MADSASYADCRERATPQRSRGARANEHVAASKPRGGGDTARRNSENILENLTRGKAGQTTRLSEIGNSLAGPSRRRLAQPAPGPTGDIFKITGPSPTRSVGFQSHATSARPGQRVSNLTGRLPGLVREILRIFSLFLRAVSPPPRGYEAATCSLARAPRLLWGVARSLQSAYEAESVMPLYRPSDTVVAAWVT